jgi:cytochrome c-type biogenesis protein CcmH
MTAFVLSALALTAAVVGLLLYPLLLRERRFHAGSTSELSIAVLREQLSELDAQRQEGLLDARILAEEQAELEKRALEDGGARVQDNSGGTTMRRPRLAAAIGLFVPAFAAGMYFWLGSPDALGPPQSADTAGNHALDPRQIQDMATKLAERLQNNPTDGEGWLMLARSYSVLERYAEASAAFGRATTLLPPSASLLADYAEVVAMAQGQKLAGDPEKIIARALEIDPRHVKSLALSGSAAFERGDFARAVKVWRTILTLVPPDSQVAQSISNGIADAERKMGQGVFAKPATDIALQKAPVAGRSVSGSVVLAPNLKDKVPADAALFVFARNTDGSRVPLAMVKVASARLPFRFMLDDSMSMVPNARLSNAQSVIVGARLSLSGDAIAKPGDFEGFSSPVAVGTAGVVVTIGAGVK